MCQLPMYFHAKPAVHHVLEVVVRYDKMRAPP